MDVPTGDIVLHVISVSIIIVSTSCRSYGGGFIDAWMKINQHITAIAKWMVIVTCMASTYVRTHLQTSHFLNDFFQACNRQNKLKKVVPNLNSWLIQDHQSYWSRFVKWLTLENSELASFEVKRYFITLFLLVSFHLICFWCKFKQYRQILNYLFIYIFTFSFFFCLGGTTLIFCVMDFFLSTKWPGRVEKSMTWSS